MRPITTKKANDLLAACFEQYALRVSEVCIDRREGRITEADTCRMLTELSERLDLRKSALRCMFVTS